MAVGVLVVALFGAFEITRGGAGGGADSSSAAYQSGQPGKGQPAPGFSLVSTAGATVDLAGFRGKRVLLYFQEGLGCQPCWDQIKDIDKGMEGFTALRISQVVTITSDPVNLLTQKVQDEGITTPVVSDPDLGVSRVYTANQYGMMGESRDGHTFVVVGPDGRIQWRADYGGAPNYTMYVPLDQLLAALRAGLGTA
jgi:peroxiredoxin Q/BCP